MKNSPDSPKTFCILPWVQVAINSTGYLRLCCNSTPGMNILRDDKDNKIHINKIKNLDFLKSSDWLNSIRSKMLKGEEVEICQRCYTEEKSNIKSARQGWNHKFQSHIPMALQETHDNGSTNYIKTEYIDLRLGNLCNLKCRMCNPYASKKWLEDWNRVQEKKINSTEVDRLSKVDWFKEEMTWDLLSKLSESTKEIYFTGGEPFLILQHKKLIQYLKQNGFSKKIKLKYNTNLTVLPRQITEEWQHFKKVTVNVSLDGVGELNDYIRNPSVWSEIEFNLKQLRIIAQKHKNICVNVHTTAQAYNVNQITDLHEYLLDFPEFNRAPFINILNHPTHLNVRILPYEAKVAIKGQIDQWVADFTHFYKKKEELDNIGKLLSLSQYMIKEDWSEKNPDFLAYTKNLDKIRRENFSEANREIAMATNYS